MRIINFSDARNRLRAVIDQVLEDAEVTIISRRDAPDAVVMSFDFVPPPQLRPNNKKARKITGLA